MSTYSNFSSGGPLGKSFVRQNDDGTYTQFFWDEDNGILTTKEFTDAALTNLFRTLQYNTSNDGVMDYAAPVEYAIENIDILGNGDDDKIYNGLNDYIEGNGGNDILYAVDGHNQVSGGAGNDDVGASEGNDLIFGNDDNDHVYGGSGSDYVFGGSGVDLVEGNGGEDVLSGGTGNDVIRGGNGHDIIFDLYGDNEVHGESGDDYIITGNGADTIYGDEGDDIIRSFGGADTIYGDDGDDIIFAGDGADKVYGGDNDDVLYGEALNDYMDGGAGDDILYGGSGADELKGRGGNDKLYADEPNSTEESADKLRGGDGDDWLFSGSGVDFLYGENDNDVLVGRSNGQAKMYGGAGDDTFAFDGVNLGHHAHRIEDLQANDHINVSDVLQGFDALSSDINDFIMLVYRDATRTDIKVSVEGTGHDWQSLALLAGDFGGVSVDDMYASGQLVADYKLFGSDV